MIKLNIEYGNVPVSTIGHNPESTYVTKHGLLFTDKASVVLNTLMNGAFSLLVIDLRESLMIYQTPEIQHFGKCLESVVKYYQDIDRNLEIRLYLPMPQATGSVNGIPMIPLVPTQRWMPDLKVFDKVSARYIDLTDAIQNETTVQLDPLTYCKTPLEFIRVLGVKQPITRVVCDTVVQYNIFDMQGNIWRFDVEKYTVPVNLELQGSTSRVYEYSRNWGAVLGELE